MPGLNGTGPMGLGSMTGRGAGYCNSSDNKNVALQGLRYGFRCNRGCGRGNGRSIGRGFNRACGWGYSYPGYVNQDERHALVEEEAILENELKQVKDRLNRMNSEAE